MSVYDGDDMSSHMFLLNAHDWVKLIIFNLTFSPPLALTHKILLIRFQSHIWLVQTSPPPLHDPG